MICVENIFDRPIERHGKVQTCNKQSDVKAKRFGLREASEFMAFPNRLLKYISKEK